MSPERKIHIVSFDVPYPPNYGGVIDVFFKIKALKSRGVGAILHCFTYGREQQQKLNDLCEKVYYYPRQKKFLHFFSSLPFIVRSRINSDLKENLLKDNYPVLFEGLHTCYLLADKDFEKRKKIFRESNIEHEYYQQLAKAEWNWLKKIFFLSEAIKLKRFERLLTKADTMLIVSEMETKYFKLKFPESDVNYLPSFHGHELVEAIEGKGNYVLFHGKLSVPENENAILKLISNVFSDLSVKVIIAGMDPGRKLKNLVKKFSNIELVSNPSLEKMNQLIKEAHIHCLYSEQSTGLKLKLLNVLYLGRFILVNSKMVKGSSIESSAVIIEDDLSKWKSIIESQMRNSFSENEIMIRHRSLICHNESEKAEALIKLIWLPENN